MSTREIDRASESLHAVLLGDLRLKDDEADRLVEALRDLMRTIADDEIDRLFNKGDYRS